MKVLVIGAGFAGTVIARELAERNYNVDIIDSRNHIGGNAYDFVNEYGITVHKYGPHIWHNNNEIVQKWISRFTDWTEYKHKVLAFIGNGTYVPLPINYESINEVLNTKFLNNIQAEEYIETLRHKFDKIENAQEYIYSKLGKEICDVFFAPYTEKMWGVSLQELNYSVVSRIPMNLSDTNYYFPNDKYQGFPKDGYTKLFERILTHDKISIKLNTSHNKLTEDTYDFIFNSMPIDAYYNYCFGKLPYRSIKFNTINIPNNKILKCPTVNFTTTEKYTRVTEWKNYPNHGENNKVTTLTYELPCDYSENNNERYYPVKDVNGEYYKKYKMYENIKLSNMMFIGRLGSYQYMDMWATIKKSLDIVNNFENSRR